MANKQVQPATGEQIEKCLKAAARRYEERGVDPATADKLFNGFVSKQAEQQGMQVPKSNPRATKLANALKQML